MPPLTKLFAAMVVMLCAFAAACGGGDGTPEVPSPTPDAFDHNVLAAIALRPDEVGGLPPSSAAFASDGKGVIYTAMYGDDAFRIQSTIARKPDVVYREEYLSQLRTGATTIVENEQNYELDGTDLAFAYAGRKGNTVSAAAVAMRGDFVQYVLVSGDVARSNEVLDSAALRRYAELTNGRIASVIDGSGRLTPPAGAPTFAAN